MRAVIAVIAALNLGAALLPAAEPERPFTELPYTPSLDPTAMDRTQDPCANLFAYACGGWLEKNPIPPDQARWSVYAKATLDNQRFLWGLLEQAAQGQDATPGSRRLGDYFGACMDEAAIEKVGATPIGPGLAAVAGLRRTRDLGRLLGGLHLTTFDGGMLFAFAAEQDFKDSSRVIATVAAGGLGLPDRDLYVNDDERSRDVRAHYAAHVARMFELLGEAPKKAAAKAATVLRIETALARASLPRVERRQPDKIYHLMSRAELQALAPSFPWDDYFAARGLPAVTEVNVSEPAFFQEMERLLARTPLDDLKVYLRWALLHDRAPYLSAAFVEEDFAFFRGYLRGVPAQPPRWQTCVDLVDRDLGEDLGQLFVARAFSPALKAEALDMVQRIQAVMERRLQGLPWMGAATRAQALEKLRGMRNKIGYPDTWRDYAGLEVRRGDFLGNALRAVTFEVRRLGARIGRPADRAEWRISAPTVNAFYNPSMNDMNFPAGVLLPPLYDARLDAAPNYGNTGGTIGHELIHGFDDEGRRFDTRGNLRDWWTADDAREFERRSACIVEQYAQYPIVDDIRINSRLTLGEDVADLAGLILAWEAWQEATAGQAREPRDGLSPEQRFFVGFAQWACGGEREESARVTALTDPHSPVRWRVNGVAVNMPEFAEAFGCTAGQPMVKQPVCSVW